LVTLDVQAGRIVSDRKLSGTPVVIFYNHQREHLYVAVGDPGGIDVFYTSTMREIGSVVNQVYAFLPETHRAITRACTVVDPKYQQCVWWQREL